MASYVTSADGTKIAFERLGQGPAVVVVGGMFCDRQSTRELAEELSHRFTVVNYDRRGRGDSGDTAPYAVEREVEDLGALIAAVGGTASVYGHSSGAGVALHAAAGGTPITRLVLHEPPYGPDDDESTRQGRQLAEGIQRALADDRRADAIKLFMADSGMPPEMLDAMSSDPKLQAIAPTMLYDLEVMGEFESGGVIPQDLVRAINIPTLVIAGGASPDFFRDTATRIMELLPDGTQTILEGHDHAAPADVVAPAVTEFLTTSSIAGRR
jgi:pimeloyl-ACP methyl ester carboxylesterase